MFGMILKDLLLVKNNLKSILIAIFIYAMFIITNEMDASFILPFMMLMIIISTFSYDDFNKWNSYAVTFPNGRENIVRGKYIATILLTLVVSILSVIISIVVYNLRNNFDLEYILFTNLGYFAAILFMISILYPVIFKYGSEKGRLAMFMFSFIVFGVIGVISKLNIEFPKEVNLFFTNYGIYFFGILIILITITSYFISKRFVMKREF